MVSSQMTSFECLHCGEQTLDHVYRTPATRVAKADNSMNPLGWYFYALCDTCDEIIDRHEARTLYTVHPDRLEHETRE